MATLSDEEVAELVPCTVDDVRKLVDLGILAPREEDKQFRSSDAHLVRLMTAFDRAGISLDDVARGVATGLDLVERTERGTTVPARVGISAGAVIVQQDDYFGRTVNIAARIADYASPHEVLVSEEAKRSAGVANVAFELVGDVSLKGVSAPVTLHRATRV